MWSSGIREQQFHRGNRRGPVVFTGGMSGPWKMDSPRSFVCFRSRRSGIVTTASRCRAAGGRTDNGLLRPVHVRCGQGQPRQRPFRRQSAARPDHRERTSGDVETRTAPGPVVHDDRLDHAGEEDRRRGQGGPAGSRSKRGSSPPTTARAARRGSFPYQRIRIKGT